MIELMKSRIARLGRRLEVAGLSRAQERALNVALGVVVVLFTAGWAVVVGNAARAGHPISVTGDLATSPLSSTAPPPATFVLDRLIATTSTAEWRGRSGAVRALIGEPERPVPLADTLGLDSLPGGARVEVQPVDSPNIRTLPATERPGAYRLLLRLRNEVRQIADATLLSPVPSRMIEDGRLGAYVIGEWPGRAERPAKLRTEEYDAPAGLIAVTPSNRSLRVSEHLTLGDFLTKGQEGVWPKYVAITPELLDKVELTLQELERMGHPVRNIGVISGFRTPWYNAHGGATAGRGSVSRHIYGDALDFYIDNDGDGQMDDLNGDGRVDIQDARIVARAANRVEQRYPDYVGGIGVYPPVPGAHSGFVHVDARGYRARW
ncbi:MAG: hypothetical protein ACOCVZ_07375 [Gemmatimonadota bacterium]